MKPTKNGTYITSGGEAVELWMHGKMIARSCELRHLEDLR